MGAVSDYCFVWCVLCSVLHLLHQPWGAAGEPSGAGGLRAQRAGGDGPITGQLPCAGVKRQAGAAGRSPHTQCLWGGLLIMKK